jgi:hypothetical protein
LAFANNLMGEWTILCGGALDLRATPAVKHHIASPDVVVDDAGQQIRMYFHGRSTADNMAQRTFVALSQDGINFTPLAYSLGPSYFRVFRHEGYWYAMSKGGLLHRSVDGLTPFMTGIDSNPDAVPGERRQYNAPGNLRHVAVQKLGSRIAVYFTRIGDKPERILRAWIDLNGEWSTWVMGPAEEIMRPTTSYEGAALPLSRSKFGIARSAENALRDPAVFNEDKTYLLYSVMGERGIAIAELVG